MVERRHVHGGDELSKDVLRPLFLIYERTTFGTPFKLTISIVVRGIILSIPKESLLLKCFMQSRQVQ